MCCLQNCFMSETRNRELKILKSVADTTFSIWQSFRVKIIFVFITINQYFVLQYTQNAWNRISLKILFKCSLTPVKIVWENPFKKLLSLVTKNKHMYYWYQLFLFVLVCSLPLIIKIIPYLKYDTTYPYTTHYISHWHQIN